MFLIRSGFVVAEKCRDRAFALMDQGRVLASITELHRAKVNWFTGDTLRPSVLAMLVLCSAYRKLGLLWAAKYYAFGAAFIIHRSNDDDLKPLFVSALHEIAECNYDAGEWIALSELLPMLLSSHYEYLNDPDNWEEHKRLQATIYHFFVARAIAKALNGEPVTELLNAPLAATAMPVDLKQDLLSPSIDQSEFERLTQPQIREKVQQELFGVPLSETGTERVYAWTALGIEWRVTCANVHRTVAQVEQLVAVLQIALADLAHRDLCLLPTKVALTAEVGSILRAKLEGVPDNSESGMKVTLPDTSDADPSAMDSMQEDVWKITLAILSYCSCLSNKDFFRALDSAFQDGLTSKLFIVRPYSELFLQFSDTADFEKKRSTWLGPPDADAYVMRTAPGLRWLDSPGPGYTPERAKRAIENRYSRAVRPIARTLDQLRLSPRFQQWVAGLRAEGRKDWWILLVLMNTVINYRARLFTGGKDIPALREYISRAMNEDEAVGALEFHEELLFGDEMKMATSTFMLTTAQVWKLTVRTQTPDLGALERLLNVRYGQGNDDVEHADPFAPPFIA